MAKKKKCACKKPGPKRKPGRPKGSGKKKGQKKKHHRQNGGALPALATAVAASLAGDFLAKQLKKMVNPRGNGMYLLGQK